MAAPVAIAAIGLGLGVAGGINSAMGAAAEGQAKANMYQYQAGVAQMNKTVADQNRDYASAAGEVEAQQSGMKTRFEIGSQKAIQSAGNLDVNSGSNLDVRTSQAAVGQENQNLIRSNAARRAYGYEVEGANATAQAQVYKMSADNAITAADYKVAGSIIGTASSVAGKWTQASAAFGSGSSGSSPFYSASQDAIY